MSRTAQRARTIDPLARVELAEADLDSLERAAQRDRETVQRDVAALRSHFDKTIDEIKDEMTDIRRAQTRGIIGQVAVAVTFASATAGLVLNVVG